ncbi:hypothetical protein L596_016309 [Steinernema carpocapsae]|uniref:Uncharacterized protein n=1 Tax=Steinernema carpocapsae TaxID=34508 RepID=A0A4U5NIE0_STECR|nr:hypothetical protein L596_016309 [Steinernema carpocapsae]
MSQILVVMLLLLLAWLDLKMWARTQESSLKILQQQLLFRIKMMSPISDQVSPDQNSSDGTAVTISDVTISGSR